MNPPFRGPLSAEARSLIATLGLTEHPEGGYYRETFRAPLQLSALPYVASDARRSASTAIYFLLPSGAFSAFHRVEADEIWHHYQGDPVDLHTIDQKGEHLVRRLGSAIGEGERPQAAVSGGVYQAAIPVGDRYALLGCTVAPGFDFADFEMPSRSELIRRFPDKRALIERLTYPEAALASEHQGE